MTPDAAQQRLMEGHVRALTGRRLHPNQSAERRAEVAAAPRPFTVILGCMDARVPPEIIFDQGLGDLFVVRVAGNAVSEIVLGSIEVAVKDFAVPLVVVLGHSRCRAVQSAVEILSGEWMVAGSLGSVVESLQPAVAATVGRTDDRAAVASRANVSRAVERLRSSEPLLARSVREGALEIAGWYYDVDTGGVEVIA